MKLPGWISPLVNGTDRCATRGGWSNRATEDVTPSRRFITFRFTPESSEFSRIINPLPRGRLTASLDSSRDRASDPSHRFHLYFSREDAEEGWRFVVLMLLPVMSSMRMTCFGNLIGHWPSCPKQVEKNPPASEEGEGPFGFIYSNMPRCHPQARVASWFSREEYAEYAVLDLG